MRRSKEESYTGSDLLSMSDAEILRVQLKTARSLISEYVDDREHCAATLFEGLSAFPAGSWQWLMMQIFYDAVFSLSDGLLDFLFCNGRTLESLEPALDELESRGILVDAVRRIRAGYRRYLKEATR